MSRSWLPHPPRTIGPRRVCPTGRPRYRSRGYALAALPAWSGDAHLTPATCRQCDGWHLTDTGRKPMTDTTPRRLQRKRQKGWRKPDNCVIVSRPSRFGNPFTIKGAMEWGGAETTEQARELCTTAFRSWLRGNRDWWMGDKADATRDRILADLHLLRGKDLACTCPLPEPGQPDHCHAAVLLRLANGPAA